MYSSNKTRAFIPTASEYYRTKKLVCFLQSLINISQNLYDKKEKKIIFFNFAFAVKRIKFVKS